MLLIGCTRIYNIGEQGGAHPLVTEYLAVVGYADVEPGRTYG